MSQKTLHSYHIFLFPFKFGGTFNADERWSSNSNPDSICQLYEYNNEDVTYYNIAKRKNYYEKRGERELSHLKLQDDIYIIYSLPIIKISLKIYHSGVGVLSFHLKNIDYEPLQDILNINQFGRRTYPPFLPLDDVKNSELSEAIWITKSEPKEIGWDNQNLFFENFENQKGVPAFINSLFPTDFQDRVSFVVHDKESQYSAKSYFYDFVHPAIFGNNTSQMSQDSVMDDRMFVICWYGNDKMSRYLQSENRHLNTDDWYRFVFIDSNNPTLQNDELRTQILKSSTYARWQKYGTFYGVSRHSFVALTPCIKTLEQPYVNAAFLPGHVRTLYYQMVELCLIQRTAVLKFASRAIKLSQRLGNEGNTIIDELKELNDDFIKFEKELYFREVTAQEQGIELYDMLQSKMKIGEEVKELHKEINHLYQEINAQHILKNKLEEEKRKEQEDRRVTLLSTVLAIFSIPSLVIAFFDMGLFKNGVFTNYVIFCGLLFSMAILIIWAFRYVQFELSNKEKSWWLKPTAGLALFGIVFLLLPLLVYWQKNTITQSNTVFPSDTTKVQEQNPLKDIEVNIPADTIKYGKQNLIIPTKKIKITLTH